MISDRYLNLLILAKWRGCGWWLLLLGAVGVTAGCSSFKPRLEAQSAFLQRAIHREDAQFRVSVAVPSPKEVSEVFDRRLDDLGIQPVWVRIENRGHTTANFLPNVIDSDYFAPLEVSYQYESVWRPKRNEAMNRFFLTNAMADRIPPGQTRSGYVFTHLDLGNKPVCVSISANPGDWHEYRYTFVVGVPGLESDWQQRRWEQVSRGAEPIECDDQRLRAELEKMPRATSNKSGKKEGDPLNLVLVGSEEDLAAMSASGWDQTERMTFGTAWRTFKSFLYGADYRYSPVSSLYCGGRHQDLAFQKARGAVKMRNHLRLWLTPLKYQGKPVWVGQISRDIGVRWTLKTASLTTHKINPNVDEARSYLIRDLVLGQSVKWFGFVKGAEPAAYHQPRHNLTGDPYYTDGLRVVIELSSEPVKPSEVTQKSWEVPPYKTIDPETRAGKQAQAAVE